MSDFILLDDNSKGQREGFGVSFIDDELYSSVLSHYERFDGKSDISFLSSAKLVFYHESLEDFIDGEFVEHSQMARNKIENFILDHNVPYVCFSDGHPGSIGEFDTTNNIVKLKKSVFYSRLEPFLKKYLADNVIELRILAYGENFKKEIMTRNIRALFQKYSSKRPDETLTLKDVMPASDSEPHYLEEIVALAQPAIGLSYDELLDHIEDNDVSVFSFNSRIKQILNSISRYGKNNYTWK